MKTVINEEIKKIDSKVIKLIGKITESGIQEDAFYVCDINDVIEKYYNWIKKMPRVMPYYAVKCNDCYWVLKILASLGAGFDCASMNEIVKVLSLEVNTSRIIFANPTKLPSHLRFAAKHNIEMMTFDNANELKKIKDLYPSARLILRIRSDATVAQYQLGVKFGSDAVREAPDLLKLARNMNLQVIGISFHVGSGCGEIAAYSRGIALAGRLFKLGDELGFNMHVLDIGGGFPGDKGISIDMFAEAINEALDQYFPETSGVQIIAEPGRYFVASAFTLAVMIYSKYEIKDLKTGKVIRNVYYVNDGIYGSFTILSFQNVVITPIPLSDHLSEEKMPSSVYGPTRNSIDVVINDVELPVLDVGDWLIFENMGAYTSSTSATSNSFPVSKVFLLDRNVKES